MFILMQNNWPFTGHISILSRNLTAQLLLIRDISSNKIKSGLLFWKTTETIHCE